MKQEGCPDLGYARSRDDVTTTSAHTAPKEELSALAFDILVSAVNLARNKQIRTVAVLRQQLSQHFPQASTEDVDQALRFWARRNRETGADAH